MSLIEILRKYVYLPTTNHMYVKIQCVVELTFDHAECCWLSN